MKNSPVHSREVHMLQYSNPTDEIILLTNDVQGWISEHSDQNWISPYILYGYT